MNTNRKNSKEFDLKKRKNSKDNIKVRSTSLSSVGSIEDIILGEDFIDNKSKYVPIKIVDEKKKRRIRDKYYNDVNYEQSPNPFNFLHLLKKYSFK
jgi:hypothetical protein